MFHSKNKWSYPKIIICICLALNFLAGSFWFFIFGLGYLSFGPIQAYQQHLAIADKDQYCLHRIVTVDTSSLHFVKTE